MKRSAPCSPHRCRRDGGCPAGSVRPCSFRGRCRVWSSRCCSWQSATTRPSSRFMGGTVGITAVGMFGGGHGGWGLTTMPYPAQPDRGEHGLEAGRGRRANRAPPDPSPDRHVRPRRHRRGSAARFTRKLVELIEGGHGLESIAPQPRVTPKRRHTRERPRAANRAMIVSEPGVERQGRTTRHGACGPCSGYPHSSAGAAGLHLHLKRVRQPGGPSIGVRGLPLPALNGTDLPINVPRPAT